MVSNEERIMDETEIMKRMRAKQSEYKRAWRRQHPDKVRAANERYWRKRVMQEMEEQQNGTNE